VQAVHLVDRHLPLLEAGPLQLLGEGPEEQGAGQRPLVGEPGRVERLEAGLELPGPLQVGGDRGRREVGGAVVVAVVTEHGGGLRLGGQRVLQYW
jgi:hypothetical protein